jgi:hypothetical protein
VNIGWIENNRNAETESVAAKSQGTIRITPCIASAGETALSSAVTRKPSDQWPTLATFRRKIENIMLAV